MLWRLLLPVLCVLASLATPAGADESGQPMDIEYAEIQPLATKSLLLDILRAPAGRLVAVGERGHVVLSDDDGRTWRQAQVVPTRSTLTTIEAAGRRLWAAGHDMVIITSGDGGETWTRQLFDPDRQQPVMDLVFDDEQHGVAIGAYGLYLTTEDGGDTWLDERVDEENEYHLNAMVRFDDGKRIIAGEAGYSYRSLDDGQTWQPLDLPYQGSMWGAKAIGGCVLLFGLRGHMLESCDSGERWRELQADTLSSLSGAASDGATLVVAGNSGTVLIREGRGPFIVHAHSSGVDFASVLALGDGRFILVGEDGAHHYPEEQASGTDEAAGNPGS